MNKVIQTLTKHRSFHHYLNTPIADEALDAIIRSAQAAPSWIGGQHVSIIAVRDTERKQKLAEVAGNQAHIVQAPVFLVFCADFHRAHIASNIEEAAFAAVENIDVLLVGATDVGLAMGNAIAAAESLGLGIVPIGGIRRNPLAVIDMLNLPKHVIPISGLCIGYGAEDPEQKPRLPKEAIYHEEKYNHDVTSLIHDYNQTFSAYTKAKTKGERDTNWSQQVAGFYNEPFYRNNGYPDVAKMLKQQGFPCNDMQNND